MKLHNLVLALGLAGLGVLQQVSSAKALSWDWSYKTEQNDIASGTWETNGTAMTEGQTYKISSITGTFNSVFGNATILGLNNTDTTNIGTTPDQSFIYTPSDSTNKFKFTTKGILFNTTGSSNYNKVSLYDKQPNINGTIFYGPAQALTKPSGGVLNETQVTQTNAAITAVPFDFTPAEGAAVGVPLFIGLRLLSKKRLARKSTAIKAALNV